MQKIRGIIIPVDWNIEGEIISLALSTHDEKEFIIDVDEDRDLWMSFVRKQVEVIGTIRKEEEKAIIKIIDYCLI